MKVNQVIKNKVNRVIHVKKIINYLLEIMIEYNIFDINKYVLNMKIVYQKIIALFPKFIKNFKSF
jgi:hypothetical protein